MACSLLFSVIRSFMWLQTVLRSVGFSLSTIPLTSILSSPYALTNTYPKAPFFPNSAYNRLKSPAAVALTLRKS
jgi:hypothetical protein